MLIADSYLGTRFSGSQTASDAYDDFLKKRGASAPRSGGAPGTKKEQRKAKKEIKKEIKRQAPPGQKKPGLFGKKKAATGMHSPMAKKTGLFGIKQKPTPIFKKNQVPAPAPVESPANDLANNPESENSTAGNEAENLANGASTDLNEISDKTPNASESDPSANSGQANENDAPVADESQPGEPASEEEQYDFYELEHWPNSKRRRRVAETDSYDDPAEGATKKPEQKKGKGISMGAVFGLLGAVAAGAIATYVVMSAGEKTNTQPLNLNRQY